MGIDAEMFVRTMASVSDEELRKLNYRLGGAVDRALLWYCQDGRFGPKRQPLHRVSEIDQDGPTIYPESGETFLRVGLFCRYYGPGYERGPLPHLILLAEWLERNIPGGNVWYGGDSSGAVHESFDREAREALIAHWASSQGNGYSGVRHNPYIERPSWGFPVCEYCGVPMGRAGYGPQYASYSCQGCGQQVYTRDGGKAWYLTHEPGGRVVKGVDRDFPKRGQGIRMERLEFASA